MRSHVNITWQTGSASEVSAPQAGAKPVLILYGVMSATSSKSKRHPYAKQGQETDLVLKAIESQESQYYLVGALSRYFKCIKVDVTDVDKKSNKDFCNAKAPLIVLYDKAGVQQKKLSGGKNCTHNDIASAMAGILDKDGFGGMKSASKKWDDLLKKLLGAEIAFARTDLKIKDLEAKLSDGKTKKVSSKNMKAMEKALEKTKEQLEKDKADRDKLAAQEKEILSAVAAG